MRNHHLQFQWDCADSLRLRGFLSLTRAGAWGAAIRRLDRPTSAIRESLWDAEQFRDCRPAITWFWDDGRTVRSLVSFHHFFVDGDEEFGTPEYGLRDASKVAVQPGGPDPSQ
jgi:hypothetical protein